jgi:phosphatidylglycerophosphatase A
MKILWTIAATFFGLGYAPLAPGTVTSLAVLILYKLVLSGLPRALPAGIFVILLVVGTCASSAYAARVRKEDPGAVVIDEAAGQLLVFLTVPPAWLNLGLGFALFRFFDILKPFPISRAERLPGGWGIMADDLAAAVAAGIVLHLYLFLK